MSVSINVAITAAVIAFVVGVLYGLLLARLSNNSKPAASKGGDVFFMATRPSEKETELNERETGENV